MDTWINQGGYPLVVVAEDGTLAQTPFSYRGEPGGAIGSTWLVPVLTRALDDAEVGSQPILLGAPTRVADAARAGPGAGALVVNAGGSGYFRVSYPTATVERLAGRLGDLDPLERYNLVSVSYTHLDVYKRQDVLWFRLPHVPEEINVPGGAFGGFARGHILGGFDRKDYWQVAFVIAKGSYQSLRTEGIEGLRRQIVEIEPRLTKNVESLTDWHQVSLLSVESSRCRRWYAVSYTHLDVYKRQGRWRVQ